MAVGLIAPFLTEDGQREVHTAYGVSADDLFDRVSAVIAALDSDTMTAAALVATAHSVELAIEASERLADRLESLPPSLAEAQAVLDGWARRQTFGLVDRFPLTLTTDTEVAVGSAVAVDDRWAAPGTQSGRYFHQMLPADDVLVTPDGRTVVVRNRLSSGAVFSCATSDDGLEAAHAALGPTADLDSVAVEASKWIRDEPVSDPVEPGVRVFTPEFTIRSDIDLLADAARWGLVSASDPAAGVPGFGTYLYVSDAVQSALIEVTASGLRAAAVTAIGITRASIPLRRFTVPTLRLEGDLAFTVTVDGLPTPLFVGQYVA